MDLVVDAFSPEPSMLSRRASRCPDVCTIPIPGALPLSASLRWGTREQFDCVLVRWRVQLAYYEVRNRHYETCRNTQLLVSKKEQEDFCKALRRMPS